MPRRWKIIFGAIAALAALAAIGVGALSLPAVQRALVGRFLPQGAEVERVRVRLGEATAQNFVLPLAGGGEIRVASARATFNPWAVFDRRIEIDRAVVKGVDVRVTERPERARRGAAAAPPEQRERAKPAAPAESPAAPTWADGLYRLARTDWTLAWEELRADGRLMLPGDGAADFEIRGGGLGAGKTGAIQWEVAHEAAPDAAGPRRVRWTSSGKVRIAQGETGGVRSVELTHALDAGVGRDGARSLESRQRARVTVDGAERTARISARGDLRVPRPGDWLSQLETLGAIELSGQAKAGVSGDTVTVRQAEATGRSGGREALSLELLQPVDWGAPGTLEGPVMEVRLNDLPWAWIEPWLPGDTRITGQPLNFAADLVARGSGRFAARFDPVSLGPVSVARGAEPLVREARLDARPEATWTVGEGAEIAVRGFELATPNGRFAKGEANARYDPTSGRLRATADLSGDLAAMVGQPFAEGLDAAPFSKLGEYALDGAGSARSGSRFRLDNFDFRLRDASGKPALTVEMASPTRFELAPFALGPEVSGPIARLRMDGFPAGSLASAWPSPIRLRGAELGGAFVLEHEAGAYRLTTGETFRAEGVNADFGGRPALRGVALSADPAFEYADGRIRARAPSLVARSGQTEVLTASLEAAARSTQPWESLQASLRVSSDLPALFRQPALSGRANFGDGRLEVSMDVPGERGAWADFAAELAGARPPEGGSGQDYAAEGRVTRPADGAWAFEGRLRAGATSVSPRRLDWTARIRPNERPARFEAEISGPGLRAEALAPLRAIFAQGRTARGDPAKDGGAPSSPTAEPSPPASEGGGHAAAEAPWSGARGHVDLNVDAFVLPSGKSVKAIQGRLSVTPSAVTAERMSARLGEGRVSGSGEIAFDADRSAPYAVTGSFKAENMSPSFFAGAGGTMPVTGRFAGNGRLEGRGESPRAAINAAQGEARLTGSDGRVTAFELEGLGRVGAGIGGALLGQALQRPGITALSRAIPFFREIPFDQFVFELRRGEDKRLEIAELLFRGESLFLKGSGSIAADKLLNAIAAPMDLELDLGAKGELSRHLETLGLLSNKSNEAGYRLWERGIVLRGSLAQPDATALRDLLRRAVRGAAARPSERGSGDGPQGADGTTAGEADGASANDDASEETREGEAVRRGLEILNRMMQE